MYISQNILRMSLVCVLLSPFFATMAPATYAQTCPTLQSGDVFKIPSLSTVYFVNENGERMFFPNGEVYSTWFADYTKVITIDSSCVDAYPAPILPPYGMTYRAGSRLVTTPLTSKVYAVLPDNTIEALADIDTAAGLYGPNWGTLVRDVPEVYWNDYKKSSQLLDDVIPHDGMLVENPNGEKFLVENGALDPLMSSEIAPYMKNDFHKFSNEILAKLTGSSPQVLEQNKVVDGNVFDQVMGKNKKFIVLQPQGWSMSNATTLDDLIGMYGIDVSGAQSQLLDFSAFALQSGNATAMIGVIAQPLKGDETGILDVVQRLQYKSSTLVDEVLQNSGLTLEFGDTSSVFIDGSVGTRVDATLLENDVPIWRYSFVEAPRNEQYFLVFVSDAAHVSEHTALFNTVVSQFSFN